MRTAIVSDRNTVDALNAISDVNHGLLDAALVLNYLDGEQCGNVYARDARRLNDLRVTFDVPLFLVQRRGIPTDGPLAGCYVEHFSVCGARLARAQAVFAAEGAAV